VDGNAAGGSRNISGIPPGEVDVDVEKLHRLLETKGRPFGKRINIGFKIMVLASTEAGDSIYDNTPTTDNTGQNFYLETNMTFIDRESRYRLIKSPLFSYLPPHSPQPS